MIRPFIVVAALIISSSPICAAPNNNEAEQGTTTSERESIEKRYDGFVTNQTITVAGQEFFQYFSAFWNDKPLSGNFALSVRERPSARWGNQVFVEYRQRRIFAATLPPNRGNLRVFSEQAVEISYKNAIDAETERLLFRDQDIAKDEM